MGVDPKTKVWLVNTGWTGGPYGVGERYPIPVTRKIVRSVQSGLMANAAMEKDPIFGLQIPTNVDGLDSSVLFPNKSWSSQEAYEDKAKKLASSFHKQMEKFGDFYTNVKEAGPTI